MTLPLMSNAAALDCPSDESLLVLLAEEQLTATDESTITGHLNACESCRYRLESFAGEEEAWRNVQRHLSALQNAETPPIGRFVAGLTASLSAPLGDTTRILADQDDNFKVAPEPTQPSTIGPYRIDAILGHGGMGVVYRGWDGSLQRHVAIKVINAVTALREESCEEFRREARAVAAVRSPYVIAIHAIAEDSSPPYLVMEYVPGESLEHVLQRQSTLPWQEAVRIGADIARGLAAVHAAGVIHRDVKPGNVLLEIENQRVRLGDFGLAHTLSETSLTRTGCIRGTPEFISPEQAEGRPLTQVTDLFSLGSVLYSMLAGVPPFRATTAFATLRNTVEAQPRSLLEYRSDLPDTLVQLVETLLQKKPDNRLYSASEVAQRLAEIQLSNQVALAPDKPKRAFKNLVHEQRSTLRGKWTLAVSILLFLGLAAGFLQYGTFGGPASTDQRGSPTELAQVLPGEAAKEQKNDDAPPADKQPKTISPPTRVQIVSPEGLMKERIREEKDQIELPRHPLLVREYKGHTGPVSSIAIPGNQEFIVSASGWPDGDRTARVWDFATGKELRQFDSAKIPLNPGQSGDREAPGEIGAIQLSSDGKEAVTGSTGGAVGIWEVSSGKLLRTFDKHQASVYTIAIDNQNRVLSGGRDKVARLWDLKSGNVLLELAGNRSFIRTTAISSDGKLALTGGLDKVLRLWDLTEAKLLQELPQEGWIWSTRFHPSGKLVAIATGNVAKIIDLAAPYKEIILRGHHGAINCIDISSDGRWIATCSYDRTVKLWSADDGKLIKDYTGHRDWVWQVVFTPDGQQLVSAGGGRHTSTGGTEKGIDHAIRLWKLPPSEPRLIKP